MSGGQKHIAERLTDVLEMERMVRGMAEAKDLTIVQLAVNDEVGRAADALTKCWFALERLRSITEQVKLEKPR